jgi:hypothetical protein
MIDRGDYGQHLRDLYGLPLLTKEYFLIAMDYFRSKYASFYQLDMLIVNIFF